LNEAMRQPHLRERGTVRRVEDPQIGAFDIPGIPARFSRWPGRTELSADLLGAHNDDVLRELLGLSDSEIAALYAEKILVRDQQLEKTGSRDH
jgi:CoA:oxalate CoA-transferase